MIPYKFSQNATEGNINKELLSNPLKWLEDRMTGSKFNFGVMNILGGGVYREMGYAYDFKEYLHKYVYNQYGSWHQCYALNKTNVRHLIGGKINQIIQA